VTRAHLALGGEMTLRALLRRRLTIAILVMLPLALYLASHDAVGRSVRALVFGISWAVSTVAYFATTSARELEPRLRLAGRGAPALVTSRITALVLGALALCALFWAIVAVDQPVRSPAGVALDFAVTAAVAVAFGTAVGTIFTRELEGTLVLFVFAGLQAIADPFDSWSRLLPFWSSRELGTYAIDGPAHGSLGEGLVHAAAVIVICAAGVAIADLRRATVDVSATPRRRPGTAPRPRW
jgi:hypothetical protein